MTPYYEHGGITIYHGDCLAMLDSLDADVLVTDPPYGIDYSSNHGASWEGTKIEGDADTGALDSVMSWWGDRPAIVFGSWKLKPSIRPRGLLVWDKGPASGMGDLSFPWKMSHEFMFVYGDGFEGKRTEGVLKGHTVVTWESKGRCHPTQKPTSLLRELIGKCPSGVVLDPFMGSGSTLLASRGLGRKAIGIEIEERYCEIAALRLSQEVLPFGEEAA